MTGSHTITSNPLPTAPQISANDVCLNGGDLVFTAADYSGSLTWVWADGGEIGGENNTSVTFAGTLIGTKTVKAQTSQTYTNAPTCYSVEASKSAMVNALPSITVQPQSQVFCDVMGEIALTVTAQPGSGNTLAYQWKTGAGTDVGDNSATYSATVSATADYWVVLTDNNGCATTSNKATVTVSGSSGGTIGETADKPEECSNGGGRIGV
jgi:hypothetical protein